MILITRNEEKPQMKINSLKKTKTFVIPHTWSDNSFKNNMAYRALSFLHEGLLEITLTVCLQYAYSMLTVCLQYAYSMLTYSTYSTVFCTKVPTVDKKWMKLCSRDALLIGIMNSLTSIFAGVVVFAILGNLADGGDVSTVLEVLST